MGINPVYLGKRSLFLVFTLFFVSFIVFYITQILPGNAAVMILGQYATDESIHALEQELGLYKPWYVQYYNWITGFLTGDWGTSYLKRVPVLELIQTRAIISAQLAILTFLMVILTAIPLGVIAAYLNNTRIDRTITSFSYIGISMPEFVTGTLLILLFAGPIFDFFPTSGYRPLSDGVVPWIQHLVLPVVTLTILLVAHILRLTRAEMIETLQSDYVRTARLKGLNESKVLFKHALRNGLMPTITLLALDVGYLMGSVVIVEEVFAIPGLGRTVVDAIGGRDLPVIQASILVIAITYVLANLGADLLYSYLDPRIEYE